MYCTIPPPLCQGKLGTVTYLLIISGQIRVFVYRFNQNETELYNLDKDIGEKNNLAKAEPERTRELLATLNQWVKETRQKSNNDMR